MLTLINTGIFSTIIDKKNSMQKGEVFTRALPFDDESHRGIKSRTNKILKKGGA